MRKNISRGDAEGAEEEQGAKPRGSFFYDGSGAEAGPDFDRVIKKGDWELTRRLVAPPARVEEERVGRLSGVLHTFEVRKLIMSPYVGEWCRLPYPGHKRGCPKYGTSPDCPPRAIFIGGLMDLCGPIFLVYAQFDLQAHMAKMKEKHPGWTERQCRNVLYWQGAVRAELKRNVAAAMGSLGCNAVTYCPEGNGVNVYATARASGLRLERIKGLKIDRHVALIGRAVNSEW